MWLRKCRIYRKSIGKLRVLSIIFIVVILSLIMMFIYKAKEVMYGHKLYSFFNTSHGCQCSHKSIVDSFYEKRKTWKLSKMGAMLYNNEFPKINKEKRKRKFEIYIWKFYRKLAGRHIMQFGNVWRDPLRGCSVNNCEFTGNEERMHSTDAVIVHLHRGQIPSLENRNPRQKWIFLNDESPFRVFNLAYYEDVIPVNISDLHNVFNWSMMYRSDSDVPVPYGRTVPLMEPKYSSSDPPIAKLIPNWNRKIGLLAVLMSNCKPIQKKNTVKKLMKYINVDFYGRCGEEYLSGMCSGHFRKDCKILNNYLFYFVLEGVKCKEYITEKVFHNAYSKGAIPIIQGPSIQDCEKLLPPNSFLHLDNYATLKDLADDITRISRDENELLNYHKWRNHFEILNEHGYFGTRSYHYCRLCEAMNYNDYTESAYSEAKIRDFLDENMSCHQ